MHNTASGFLRRSSIGSRENSSRGGRWQVADGRRFEACFLQAIEIARRQQTKSLEMRAVRSLSGLWQRQGKRKDARQMLVEVYDWFAEGSDTADLQEAKALIEELA